MKTQITGIFVLALFCTSLLLAQQGTGVIVCNNHEARLGACVPNRDCNPDRPMPEDPGHPGDPKAKPPIPARPPAPARPCGGLVVQITQRILQCQGGVPGGHCIDHVAVVCAQKAFCVVTRDANGEIVCMGKKADATGITGWQTDIESIPCITREPLKTNRINP